MTFKEIKENIAVIKEAKELPFDLSWINSDIGKQLDDFVRITDHILYLQDSIIDLKNPESISVRGKIYFKGLNQLRGRNNSANFLETSILLFNTPKPDYLITVEPGGDWEKEVNGPVKAILKVLPVSFKDVMFINASMDLKKATIMFDKNRIYELGVSKGMGIVAHISNKVLEKLKIPDTLFQIARAGDGTYRVFKELNFKTAIAGIFNILVTKIELQGKESIRLETEITLPMPGAKLEVPASLLVNKDEYEVTVKLKKNIKPGLPYFLAGDGVTVGNIEIDLQGSFLRPEFNYGLYGNFAIGGPVKPADSPLRGNELNDGDLRIFYNSTSQATLIPVFVEAFAREITLDKIVQVFAGKIIKLPKFLDDIAKFYSTYFYYCEPGQTRILVNGVEAKKGIALSSGVNLLGLEAYAEFSAIENHTKGNIILEPVNLAKLVEIGGDGSGSPAGYTGKKIRKGGVQLFFDSEGPVFFRTDVKVKLFGAYEFKTGAHVEEKGLQFYYDINLGFAKARIDCLLNSVNDFTFSSQFEAKIAGIHPDLGPLGELSLTLSINAAILLSIRSQQSDGIAQLKIGFSLNRSVHQLSLSFNIREIKSLEDIARKAIVAYIEKLFTIPLVWLQGIADGAIKIAGDTVEQAKAIANNLEKTYKKSVEDSAKLISQAGYKAEDAARILKEGFKQPAENAAKLLKDAGYTAEQAAESLINIYKLPASAVCKILKPYFSPVEIGNALKKYSSDILKELPNLYEAFGNDVGQLLNGMGKTTKEAGQLLTDVLKKNNDAVAAILTLGKYPVAEIVRHFPKPRISIPNPIPRIPKCVKIAGRRICR